MGNADKPNADDRERLIRIETKLDILITADADKERRLRELERKYAQLVGACLASSVFFPIAIPVVLKLIGI